MARKKGSGKTKTTGRKISTDVQQAEKKTDAKLKDDPGGGGAAVAGQVKPAMEASNYRSESKLSQRQLSNGDDDDGQTVLTPMSGNLTDSMQYTQTTIEHTDKSAIPRNTTAAISSTVHNKNINIVSVPAPPATVATATVTATANSTPSNLKYLHKKFKRIASATLTEEEEQQYLRKQEQDTLTAAQVLAPGVIAGSPSSSLPSDHLCRGGIEAGNSGREGTQQLATVRPSATVAPLISTPSFSQSRTLVLSASYNTRGCNISHSRYDSAGDESNSYVTVRTASGENFNSSAGVPTENSLAASTDKGVSASVASLIGINADLDQRKRQPDDPYQLQQRQQHDQHQHQRQQQQRHQHNHHQHHQLQQQQQQQQEEEQQLYQLLHTSLHPGVTPVAACHPQPLHHSHPLPLTFHHHHHQPQGLPPHQQTSANSASSSSNIIGSSISNSNFSKSVLLLPQSASVEAGAVSSSLSSAAVISDYCDSSVANKLAKSPCSQLGGTVQYIVAYPQYQHRVVTSTDETLLTNESLKHHSSVLYANGRDSLGHTQPPVHHVTSLSSSSGGSSGSPSPSNSAVSNLEASSGPNLPTVNNTNTATTTSGAIVVPNVANIAVIAPGPPGRYVCPYCQMNCSKPSVLEKHIRRHTNERPFKCDLCGIAFKTKSNLYKHRRSRAHASKRQGEDAGALTLLDEDCGSLGGSDIDDKELSNSGSEIMTYRGSPMDERVNSPQHLLVEKPYKPKFHNAALYAKFDSKPFATVGPIGTKTVVGSQPAGIHSMTAAHGHPTVYPSVSHYLNGQNVESLEQHISKLISQNEAIVEVVEAPLQKKYHKITGISRGISVSGNSTSSSQSTSSAMANSSTGASVPQQNTQLFSVQDAAATRLAYTMVQKRHVEEQQVQLQHMQHLLQVEPQKHQQLQIQPYITSHEHLPGPPSVISFTNRPVVTPKSTVILQQQLPQSLASVVVVDGILPSGGSVTGTSKSLTTSALENIVKSSPSSNIYGGRIAQNNTSSDGGSFSQPLNLTKTNAPEQGQSITTVGNTISERNAAVAANTQMLGNASLIQQSMENGETLHHLLPSHRKRTREQSPLLIITPSSPSSAQPMIIASISVTTGTTTTSSTTTPPVAAVFSLNSVTSVSSVCSHPPHVPLHIQVSSSGSSSSSVHRPTPTPTPPLTVANHPQNPERSIIKDLLLNSRGFGVVQNPDSENGENLYTCKMCNVSFRDVDSLKYHMICYCQGSGSNLNSPSSSSAPISPVGSPSAAAASYIRSRSVSSLKHLARSSLNPPSTSGRTPSSLSKLAKSQLTRPRMKPENISLVGANPSTFTSAQSNMCVASGSGTSSGSKADTAVTVQNPLPSPGPLLGNTRLVDSHRADCEKSQKMAAATDLTEATPKRSRSGIETSSVPEMRTGHRPHRATSGADISSSEHNTLQLFASDIEVIESKTASEDERAKLSTSLPVHRYNSEGTFTLHNSGMEMDDEGAHERALHYRRTLHSGGTLLEVVKSEASSARPSSSSAVSQQGIIGMAANAGPTHFQFPPINSITAFNPITFPTATPPGQATQIVHGGKIIPFVQGIPGPNTLSSDCSANEFLPSVEESISSHIPRPLLTIAVPGGGSSASMTPARLTGEGARGATLLSYDHLDQSKKLTSCVKKNGLNPREIWSPAKQQADISSLLPTQVVARKSFNFTRIADNVTSPEKRVDMLGGEPRSKLEEVRYFNFETMISTSEILIKPPPPPPGPSSSATMVLTVDTSVTTSSGLPHDQSVLPAPPKSKKFLRPNTLPLKPGTFTPKRHHGITPTNNTMPLISPETPRPSKSCRELYFNGHAYTNIGLKSSTKPFYCTVNKTQPFYFQTQKQLSMYGNWQVHPENNPHPLGLKQVTVMALYDSNQQRDRRYSIAGPRIIPLTVISSAGGGVTSSEGRLRVSSVEVKSNVPCPPTYVLAALASQHPSTNHQPTVIPYGQSPSPGLQYSEKSKSSSSDPLGAADPSTMVVASGDGSGHPSRSASAERALSGGFESTEEYTYVRGRGRGKYVCNECGIRCKKPSMLKKHIRTHTDVRPYSCQYCNFHFKTKGNLTKHMKSKSHYKKCTELGINPVPVHVDDDGGDIDIEGDLQSISSERTSTIPGDSDTPTDTDCDETDDSEEMKGRLPEHEAAEGLLSLSMTRPTSACSSIGTGNQSSTVCTEPTAATAAAYITRHISSYVTQEHQHHGLFNPTLSPNLANSPLTNVNQQHHEPAYKTLEAMKQESSSVLPRRIITYGNGPKLEMNLLKHEQYYSDPNVGNRKKREQERLLPNASDEAARAGDADDEDDTARPIDLTKKPRHQSSVTVEMVLGAFSQNPTYHPYDGQKVDHQSQQATATIPNPLAMKTPPQSQHLSTGHLHRLSHLEREQEAHKYSAHFPQQHQVIVRVSDVLTPITGAASLLTTLVSNTDKIPLILAPYELTGGTTPPGVDENTYFHEYLKERALQETRIKQSQMKPGNSIVMHDTTSPQQSQHLLQNQPSDHQRCHLHPAPAFASPNSVIEVAQAPLDVRGSNPPADLSLLTASATFVPSTSAAAVPTSTTTSERVYRIFSGKNERHRPAPTMDATRSASKMHTETHKVAESGLGGETVRVKNAPVEVDTSVTNVAEVTPTHVAINVVTTSSMLQPPSDPVRLLDSECPMVPENASPMDTLAEIAAGYVKLDVSKVQSSIEHESPASLLPIIATPIIVAAARSRCNSISSTTKGAIPVPESAKNLASEYLKLAQSVTNIPGAGGVKRKRADSENAGGTISDQESATMLAPLPMASVASAASAPVPDGGQKPIATVAPIIANISLLSSSQGQSTIASAGCGGAVAGNVGANGAAVQGIEVAASVIGPSRKVVVVGEDGFKKTVGSGRPVASAVGEFVGTPPSAFTPSMHQEDGGRPVCEICNKKFHKLSQLSIHMNIHYMERKYRCEPCGTSFRSQGLYLKHERSATHRNKVSMTTTFGVATDTNPRPFYCRDCEVGFRIHGHLAKHLRSKMHVLKLECLGKLPFGTYTEIERSGTNLTEIDTSDCENSLSSLKRLAARLNVKDPSKVLPGGTVPPSSSSSSSSSSSGGAMGSRAGGGGTSGNETDSCDDNFGVENDEDESPSSGGAKGETSPDDASPSDGRAATVNGEGAKDIISIPRQMVRAADISEAMSSNGGELRNINNNVKRKIDDISSTGVAADEATCSTNDNPVSNAKQPRYTSDLLGDAGNGSVPMDGAVTTNS